jgi:hypothetical protein
MVETCPAPLALIIQATHSFDEIRITCLTRSHPVGTRGLALPRSPPSRENGAGIAQGYAPAVPQPSAALP